MKTFEEFKNDIHSMIYRLNNAKKHTDNGIYTIEYKATFRTNGNEYSAFLYYRWIDNSGTPAEDFHRDKSYWIIRWTYMSIINNKFEVIKGNSIKSYKNSSYIEKSILNN